MFSGNVVSGGTTASETLKEMLGFTNIFILSHVFRQSNINKIKLKIKSIVFEKGFWILSVQWHFRKQS